MEGLEILAVCFSGACRAGTDGVSVSLLCRGSSAEAAGAGASGFSTAVSV